MREIKFEYGFEKYDKSIIKKVYSLSQIPNIKEKCDLWDEMPISYVRQFTGLQDKSGIDIYEGDIVKHHVLWGDNQVRDEIEGNVYFLKGTYYINSDASNRDGIYHKKLEEVISSFKPEKYSCKIIGNIYQYSEMI